MAKRTQKIVLKDVADRAKVSLAAASMALADHPEISAATKRRVVDISRKLGYATPRGLRPAAPSGRGITGTQALRFGFLLIGSRLEDEVFAGMLQALLVSATDNGVRVEVSAIENVSNIDAVVKHALTYGESLDGLLLMGEVSFALLAELDRAKITHTVVGYMLSTAGEDTGNSRVQVVTTDEDAMGRLAAAYLIKSGHRRIGFVCEILQPGLVFDRWLAGYASAHLSAGLSVDRNLIQIAGRPHVGGREASERFSTMQDAPTAYVIPDARTAASFLQAMRERGAEVAPRNVVIGGQPFIVQRYGLEKVPQILEDLPAMATIALQHLRQLCQYPAAHAAHILVPFSPRNLTMR